MITNRIAQLKKLVKLAPARKEVLKTRLFAELRGESALRPRPHEVIARPAVARGASWFGRLMSAPAFAAALVLVLVSGGTAAAAERTRPGDPLYPVKVNVNERVIALFSVGDAARAKTETRLAERRLIEASELAAEGKLEDGLKDELEGLFEVHAARAQETINALTASGKLVAAAEAASQFESSLRAHQAILARAASANPVTAGLAAPLEEKIAAKARATEKVRASLDEDVKTHAGTAPTGVAARGRIAAAEQAVATADLFVQAKKVRFGAEATARAEAKIAEAETLLVYAKAKLAVNLSGEAFVAAGEALRAAERARVLVRASRPAGAAAAFEAGASAATLASTTDSGLLPDHERENNRDREVPEEMRPETERSASPRAASETGESDSKISGDARTGAAGRAAAGVKIELKENDIESNVDTLLNAGL